MKNNSKVHYKMYKAGKHWLFAAIATTIVTTGGFALNEAHADTVSASNDATTAVKSQTDTEAKANDEPQSQNTAVTTDSTKTSTDVDTQNTNKETAAPQQETVSTSANNQKDVVTDNSDSVKADTTKQSDSKTDVIPQQETTSTPVVDQKDVTTNPQNNSSNEETKIVSPQQNTDATPVDTASEAKTPVQASTTDDVTADKTVTATNNQNMQLNTANVNLAADQPAPASDVSVDITANSPSSLTDPYKPSQNVSYNVGIHNTSNGDVVPVDTSITFKIGTPTNNDMNKFLKPSLFTNDEDNDFNFTDNGDYTYKVTVLKPLPKGDFYFTVNFTTMDPGNNWDNSGNVTDPAVVSAPVSATFTYNGNTQNLPITDGNTIYVKPIAFTPNNDPLPGYSTGYYNGMSYQTSDPEYPEGDKGYLGGTKDGTNLYSPAVKDSNGNSYVIGQVNFNPGASPSDGKSIAAIVTGAQLDQNSVKLYATVDQKWVDVTDVPNLVWTRTSNGVTVDFSDPNAKYDGTAIKQYNINLVFAMKVANTTTDNPWFGGTITWYKWTDGVLNDKPNSFMFGNSYTFQPIGVSSLTPWFVGGDQTIYQNKQGDVTYAPMTGISAYDGTTGNLTDKVTITDLGGYPAGGVNPAVGSYTIAYSVTNDENVTSTFSRVITVKASEASVSGHDVTIYAGDPMPAASAFGATATADDGSAVPADQISIDTSKVNPNVAGDYPVTISADNGEVTREVNVHVLANQAKVTAHDVTIHTGDAVPTDASAYGATAVGKDGTTPVAISSVDTSKVDNQKVGTYPVVITDADGVSTTVNVNVVANQASISGQDVTIYAGDQMPADSAFKASATDEDGKTIDVTIDTSKVNNQVAGTYPVTITAADGQTKEVSVIVLANQAKVTAHDVTIHTGDAVPTDASAYGATAVGKDGTTPVAISSVDTSKVDNQKVGTYPVVITDADGVSTTVNVNVVANQASISGQDVTIYAGDPMPADSAFKASATDEDGKTIDVTIDTSKVNNQVAGTYPVTITAADGQTKEVSVIVLANQAKVTAHDVTIHTGDAVPTDASAYGATAVGKDGTTPVAISSVDTSKVDNQKVGTYPVVITDTDGVSTTVNVNVVANQASISGQDVTIYAGDPMPADSAFKASATDEDGKTIDVTIDTSKVNNQVAGTYPVTITAADGQTKEVSVIVLANQAKVTAHDVTIHTGDAVPTDASAYGATAVGKDGTTPVAISSVDTSKVDNQKVGTYPVVITDADGVSTTVNVNVVANQASISGQDVTIYAGDPMPADSAFKASATDEDGKTIDVTIDTSKVNNQVAGTYPVTITAADGQTKEVSVIVLADQAKVTAHDVTIHTGDAVPTDASAYGATAVGKDGTTPVAISSVDISKVDNQKVGTYPVVITDADGVSTTVNVNVVANEASISGQDVTIYAGDPMPADSAFKASATDEDGKTIDVTIDTSKVNNQVAGTYPVTITAADGQTKEVSVIVLANQAKVTAHDVTIHTGDVVPTDPSAYDATAVGKDGTTPVAISSVDTSKVDNQKVGTYPVVITDADGVTTTVSVDVKAASVVPSTPDKTVPSVEPTQPTPSTTETTPIQTKKVLTHSVETTPVANVVKEGQPVTGSVSSVTTKADNQTPVSKTKKNTLPQTGQDASTSLLSIIGIILLSILGFFGLDRFRKKKEDK